MESSVFNSILLASCDGALGDSGYDGDLIHYRTKFVVLGLQTLSASRGLPGCILIIRREGTHIKYFRWL